MDETEVVVSERSPGLDGPLLVLTDILPVEDRRQGFLRSVLGEVVREGEGSQVATIDTTGFPASCVNLGWLQDKIRAYWVENVPFEEGPELDAFVLRLEGEVRRVVSRVKWINFQVKEGSDVPSIGLEFATKDDHGWYTYKFSVRAPVAVKEKGGRKLRIRKFPAEGDDDAR